MAKPKGKQKGQTGRTAAPKLTNRRARHDHHVHETMECGIALTGSEVKALRNGRGTLAQSFARVDTDTRQLWLHNMDIGPYENAPDHLQHEPKRKRKLLAHRRQINHLIGKTGEKGTTLIPLSLYFNSRGIAKVELAIATGKKKHDKRADMKRKEHEKEMRRAMSHRVG